MASYLNSEQTRKTLINAAGELAAELGFGNVTTRAIAKAAGENVGSIHYHFGGKDNLFQAVVMEATKDMRERPLSMILAGFEPVIDTPEGKSQAVRALAHAKIESLFREGQQSWHCRVIYQALRKASSLRDCLMKKVLNPWMEAENGLFARIRPGMSREECTLHALLLSTPLYFHADYMEAILISLGVENYSEEYLQKMEDTIVRQTQLLFGLPDDRKIERGDVA